MIVELSVPRMVSMTFLFFLPMQKPRIARSLALLSIRPRHHQEMYAQDSLQMLWLATYLTEFPPAGLCALCQAHYLPSMLLTLTSWQKNRPRNHLHVQRPVANRALRLNIYLIVPMCLNILYQQLRNVPITTSCFFQIFSRCIYIE